MTVRELSTPQVTVDLGVVERNLDRQAELCRRAGLGLRPHTKTHKSIEAAQMQLERGAVGLTVAKVGEAEVMAAAGLDNILVAFPVIGDEKLRRLAALARNRRMLLSLDSEAAAHQLSRAATAQGAKVGVLVEFDAGFHRCGLDAGPALVALAKTIEQLPGLEFRGLMSFFGNVSGTPEQRRAQAERVGALLGGILSAFRAEALQVDIVSGGSTPSAEFAHLFRGLTEIRPGTYIYNDMNTFHQGVCKLEDCAVRVVATVVSTTVPGFAIIDAGSKTFSSDPLNSGPKSGFGYVTEAPDAPIVKLSEEHGHIAMSNSKRTFRVGDVVTIVPNHVCSTVNLHDEVQTVRADEVVGSWKVAARGKVR